MSYTFNPLVKSGFDKVNKLITKLKATANSLFYSDSTGNIQELPLGDAGKVLTSTGTNTAPEWTDKSAMMDTNLDGGFANSTYLPSQSADGGGA